MDATISRQMARFALGLKYKDLPENVVNEVKRYLYDSVGCAYGGYHTRDVIILREALGRTVYGHAGGINTANG